MKRYRILIQAEYEFPDDAELVNVAGETAVKLAGHIVKPSLEFFQLREVPGTSTFWSGTDEQVYDSVFAAERRTTIDFVADDCAT